MSIHGRSRTYSTGDRVFAAYRKAWLASLGAAAVTRDWMQTGAAPLIRSLVREGTLVEGQAMRVVESRVGSSYRLANATLHSARRQLGSAIGRARTALPVALAKLPAIARRVTPVVSTLRAKSAPSTPHAKSAPTAPRAKAAPATPHAKSGVRRALSVAKRAKLVAKRSKSVAKRAKSQVKRGDAVHSAKPAKTPARATSKRQVGKTTRARSGA